MLLFHVFYPIYLRFDVQSDERGHAQTLAAPFQIHAKARLPTHQLDTLWLSNFQNTFNLFAVVYLDTVTLITCCLILDFGL
jgi:hypothetical protein